jgi:hypothetical protein
MLRSSARQEAGRTNPSAACVRAVGCHIQAAHANGAHVVRLFITVTLSRHDVCDGFQAVHCVPQLL